MNCPARLSSSGVAFLERCELQPLNAQLLEPASRREDDYLFASVLQAASITGDGISYVDSVWDGISSTWLIAELTHRQAHGLDSQIPMPVEADRGPSPGRHP